MEKNEMIEARYPFRAEPEEDGSWTVWFPDLPGASGQAKTIEGIGAEAEAVSAIWLESERRRNHPIPVPSPAPASLWPQGYHVENEESGQVTGVPGAALYLGISERRVQALAKERGIGRMFGRSLLFAQTDLDALRPGPVGRPRKQIKATLDSAAD